MTIGTAQAFDLGMNLPPPLAVVTVHPGLAVSQDGKPAAGVYVSVWDVTGNRWSSRAARGSHRRFRRGASLELRQGRTYTFMARDKNPRCSRSPVQGSPWERLRRTRSAW